VRHRREKQPSPPKRQGCAGRISSRSHAWYAAADGTLEERRYYLQNWRHDVVALTTDTGKLVEQDKYSAYGVPFGMPAGDIYGQGTWSATESAAMTAADGAAYDVRIAVDRRGGGVLLGHRYLTATIGERGWSSGRRWPVKW